MLYTFQKQARRIYEILRLRATDCSNESEYRAYRLDVKKRLNLPFQVSLGLKVVKDKVVGKCINSPHACWSWNVNFSVLHCCFPTPSNFAEKWQRLCQIAKSPAAQWACCHHQQHQHRTENWLPGERISRVLNWIQNCDWEIGSWLTMHAHCHSLTVNHRLVQRWVSFLDSQQTDHRIYVFFN